MAKNHDLKSKDGHVGLTEEIGWVSKSAVETRGRATVADKDHLGGVHWLIEKRGGWGTGQRTGKIKENCILEIVINLSQFQSEERKTGGTGWLWRQGRCVAENGSLKALSPSNVAKSEDVLLGTFWLDVMGTLTRKIPTWVPAQMLGYNGVLELLMGRTLCGIHLCAKEVVHSEHMVNSYCTKNERCPFTLGQTSGLLGRSKRNSDTLLPGNITGFYQDIG